MKLLYYILIFVMVYTPLVGQSKLSEQYFFNNSIDLILTQNDNRGSEGNIFMISENNHYDIYNIVLKNGWLKDFEIDTMKYLEVKNNTNIISQNKVIFIDEFFELKRNEHIATTLLKFGKAFRVYNDKKMGYVLPFELFYKEGVDGFGYGNVGAIIGFCDKNGYFYEFKYQDTALPPDFNIKIINAD